MDLRFVAVRIWLGHFRTNNQIACISRSVYF